MTTKIIDFEAHFHSTEYMAYLRKTGRNGENPKHAQKSMLDTGKDRLEIMDRAGIDIQVLNAGPPDVQQFEASEGTAWSRTVNDELSEK